jgi:hypothetical protein
VVAECDDAASLTVGGAPEDLTVTHFLSEGGEALVVHAVNTCGTLDDPKDDAGHHDTVPFPDLSGHDPLTLEIVLPLPLRARRAVGVTLHTVGGSSDTAVTCTQVGPVIRLQIDPAAIGFHALLEVSLSTP